MDMLDSVLIIGMHRLVKDLDNKTMEIVTKYDLTFPQFMVLEALFYREGLSIGEIKEKILSSDGTIPVIINNLEKLGFIERQKDKKDQRKSLIFLTKEGKEKITQVLPENKKMIEQQFAIYSQEEKKLLASLLQKYRKLHKGGK